ncbi:helix-turn-helix transcriptional regulator [Dictyobacter alpinus]|uniref:Helix-turn-helix transcriptional regulator n=1 Tax=Dictyobacter alpinus TaxID=2014873 RepID=A0A402BK41_9CHLR|nr:LuxR C-terminal-related transcriptional regulator [Dictyobacter alpinus]GCE31712.1 helix-turn-helix transcriptional regulator [Dictyobacter alpinus]
MPRQIPDQLQWSETTQKYSVLYAGQPVVPRIEPGGQRWLAWLEAISSFSFQSRSEGSCTLRKESVQRGGVYWYAYRRREGRMAKRYLGRSSDLSIARLEAMSAELNASEKDSPDPDRARTLSPVLLTTKFHPPGLPGQYIERSRLRALLEQGVQGPLTLVSAPAGSGKTTLLAAWAARTDLPLAWLSLEAADNDPARFLAYLTAALVGLHPDIHLVDQPPYPHNSELALTHLLNELTRLLKQEAVLILDDYHCLSAEAIQRLLQFLLDHLPPHLHLVIGTRTDPPLPLARLRASNQLTEIRIQELRFAVDEVEALTNTMGLTLAAEATRLLEHHTAGWVVGVQLLALALRGQADSTAFLRTFHGTHRFLLDYVSEEILAQQTPQTRYFLLHTSMLERMTGSLCDALTGQSGGQKQLEDLQRANLFVSVLDATGIWYRYHPLFAETLKTYLLKQEPETLPELYMRASHWYEQHQHMEEACDYALQAGDFAHAAQLIADLLPPMVERGRFEQLGRWLGQLPPDVIATSPQLYIATPWMYIVGQSSPEYVELALKRMEQHVEKQQGAATAWVEAKSVIVLMRALTALTHKSLSSALPLLREALHTLNRRDSALSQLIARFLQVSLSIMHGANGDLATAQEILLDLSLLQPAEPFSIIHLITLFLLGELYKAQGQLRKGVALYERFDSLRGSIATMPQMPLFVLGFALMRRSLLFYEWNRLQEAAEEIQQVLDILPRAMPDIVPQITRPALLAFGLWVQARIAWAQGKPEAASYFLELVRTQPEVLGQLPPGKERSPVDILTLAARLALVCGQLEEALHWKKTCGIHFDDMPETLAEGRQVFVYLTLARVLIASGRREHAGAEEISQALRLLERWRSLALRLDFQGWLIEIQMLTALALQVQGQQRQALITLGAVLAQAESEGYVRLFADEGQPIAQLLTHISSYTTASFSYIQRIQNAIVSPPQQLLPGPAGIKATQTPLEPLSGREREVLSLLATGASNQHIAEQLVISPHTAKRHVKNILAKLSASNRLEAVVRARELDML